jgi:MinD-like ATPase involved in chromosome partitioning or flagellar assembly
MAEAERKGDAMTDLQELRNRLEERYPGAWELEVGAEHTAVVLIVHEAFAGLSHAQRVSNIEPMLLTAGLRPGILELLTPAEAQERGVSVPPRTEPQAPASWDSAVTMIESGQIPPMPPGAGRKPKRVVFYSYKGGVGRTTALVHTAFHLARSNQRVAVVDMDVEAPGLHTVLARPDGKPVGVGLVDYLWERQVRPFDSVTGEGFATCLVAGSRNGAQAISYAVEDEQSRAQIQVIPAGSVGSDFVRRLATLSSQDVLARPGDAWSLFEKELTEQFAPDVMFIDARTGLGDWGGLSLLRLAGEAFVVLYPSDQNGEGIRFVREMLQKVSSIKVHLVLSPIPEGTIGRELVARFLPQLALEEGEYPFEIHYNPNIASALRYPVESAMPDFARLANRLRESRTEEKVEATIQKIDRWKIIESLKFPQRNAKDIAAGDFELFFQRTSDFDKFLDDARWVVRGRKGTGKSTLFHLFAEHQENAVKRARGKLDGIEILPGHGPASGATFRPTTDLFTGLQRELAKGAHDWLSLWRAYAIVRIASSADGNRLESVLKKPDLRSLKNHLQTSFPRSPSEPWRSVHTTALLAMVEEPLNGLCRDLMTDLNGALAREGRKLWLLYDDLDQDIREDSPWQGEALGGLLRLAYDSNNQDLHNIRFKVFLREDIWSKLVFTNKSHFGDPRTLLLQWRLEDFLRLAYRLATGGSAEFRTLAQRDFPLTDVEVDQASEDQLRQALAPLWGLNQEKRKNAFAARWVYSRMTDAKDNTYPRSLTVLLAEAREEELRSRNNKAPPKDRLLSPPALQAGLKEASLERVNALKNEYPLLRPFLEEIEKTPEFRSQFKAAELGVVWERTLKCNFPAFEPFVAELIAAGLIEERKGLKFDYGFASLYIDGLGVTRVQGEKK